MIFGSVPTSWAEQQQSSHNTCTTMHVTGDSVADLFSEIRKQRSASTWKKEHFIVNPIINQKPSMYLQKGSTDPSAGFIDLLS
ncbi:hypothetical protein PHET_08373 [Paragonimus heterotremus]|uniref:Uncharacterized protein n=1 Tax=Paragonimus heterotremus TaxID=100268 RepID=A0A8J4SL73_9TREM|nr:hypothetical protein PHET_08373 [Paragonimus heterotremus]